MKFIRSNELLCTTTFTPVDGSGAVPLFAEAVLVYTNLSGSQSRAVVPLARGADGVTWSGVWDSSVAKAGAVDWKVRSWGGLVAVDQGTFHLTANLANLT